MLFCECEFYQSTSDIDAPIAFLKVLLQSKIPSILFHGNNFKIKFSEPPSRSGPSLNSDFSYSYPRNPIQDGGPKSPPPTSFSSVTFAKVRISPQNFLTFSFNIFATLVQNFNFVPSASPKLLNLNQDRPSKKRFFWSSPYKIEVIITFLMEMLQLPNFGHMIKSII